MSPARLPGPPQIGQPRLPGPPPMATTPRPLGAAVATPRLAAAVAQSAVRTPISATVPSTTNPLPNASIPSGTVKPMAPTSASVVNATATPSPAPQRPSTTTTSNMVTTSTTQSSAPKAIATIIQSTMPMAGLNVNPVSNVSQGNLNADKSAPSTTVSEARVSQASSISTPSSTTAGSKPQTTLVASTPQQMTNPAMNSQTQSKLQQMTTVNTATMPNKPTIVTPSNNTNLTTTNSNLSHPSFVQTSQAGVPPQTLSVPANPSAPSGPTTGRMTPGGPTQGQGPPGQSGQTSQPNSMPPQQQTKPPHGQLQQVTGQTVTLAQQPFNIMQQQTIQRFPNQAAMAGGRGTPPATNSGSSTGLGMSVSNMPPGSQQPVRTSGMPVSTTGGPQGQQIIAGSMKMSSSGPTPTTGVGSMQTTTANNSMNPSQQQIVPTSNMMQQGMMVRPQGLPPGKNYNCLEIFLKLKVEDKLTFKILWFLFLLSTLRLD